MQSTLALRIEFEKARGSLAVSRKWKPNPLFNCLLHQSEGMDRKKFRETMGADIPHDLPDMGLDCMSLYYNYTSPPPLAYGDPIPKTAESILRAKEYCGSNGLHNIPLLVNEIPKHYCVDQNVPVTQDINCQWEPNRSKWILEQFRTTHYNELHSTALETIEYIRTVDPTILTKGRQTWCPIIKASVPSSQAYLNMIEVFKLNDLMVPGNCYEYLLCFFTLFEKETLTYIGKKKEKRVINTKVNGRRCTKVVNIYRSKQIEVVGRQAIRRTLLEWMLSFVSYLKSAERARKNRRAIASPNIIYRLLLFICEKFHLDFAKKTQGSTISIGGVEKQARILHAMALPPENPVYVKEAIQLTADATKWNECLSPELFALFDRVCVTNLDPGHEEITSLGHLFEITHYLMSNKIMYSRGGPVAENDTYFNRLDWLDSDIELFNERTKAWLKEYRLLRVSETSDYILASSGMLMGMQNAMSSNVIYAASKMMGRSIIELRSSDDSACLYYNTPSATAQQVMRNHLFFQKVMGTNLSREKSFVATKFFFEYTSWYVDTTFKHVFSMETTKIRPTGQTPHDDFNNVASGTAQCLVNKEINSPGGSAMLLLGFQNVKRLWRIQTTRETHHPQDWSVVFMADGGSPWCNTTSCQIPEAGFRLYKAKELGGDSLAYVRTCLHPDNPFIREEREATEYDWNTGAIEEVCNGTPRNVFTLTLRGNRTIKNTKRGAFYKTQRSCAKVARLITQAYPTSLVAKPFSPLPISSVVSEQLVLAYRSLPEESKSPEVWDRVVRAINKISRK